VDPRAAAGPTVPLELPLDPVPGAAPQARAALAALVAGTPMAARSADAALALTELVTNAVLHGREPLVVQLDLRADELTVSVRDGNPVSPSFSMLDPTAVTGRGLLLISATADSWGVEPRPGGKSVWFRMGLQTRRTQEDLDVDALLASWGDELLEDPADELVTVVLTDLETALTARAEAHVEGLLRELALLEGSGSAPGSQLRTARQALHAAGTLDALRAAFRHQLTVAVSSGQPAVDVRLVVTRSDAEAIRDFSHALDQADRLSRAGELLTRPAPRELSDARQRYLRRLLAQLSF
jgi:anti-sigma regulatory factor (Ser/Thr protein kinase)